MADDNFDDFFDFGSELDDTSGNEETSNGFGSSNVELENDIEDDGKKASKKKVGLIILVVGFVVILVICLASRGSNKTSEGSKKQTKQTTVEHTDNNNKVDSTTTSNTTNTVYEKVTVDNGWVRISAPEIDLSKQIKGTLTITDIQYFANVVEAQSAALEVRARAIGAIDGLDGKYTLDIPWRVTDELQVGDRVAVYYYIGTVDGQSAIVDLYYEK